MTTAAVKRRSYQDYLAIEAETQCKHEFESGVLTMMVGGSHDHALISMNLGAALASRLRGGPCRTYSSDLKTWIAQTDSAFYPDVTVVCGPSIRPDHDPHATTNPSVVAEVLSPSTRGRDATTKLLAYQSVPSLRHILLVDTDAIAVLHYRRAEDGSWGVEGRDMLDQHLHLDLHEGITVPLAEIYEQVEFLVEPEDPDSEGPGAF